MNFKNFGIREWLVIAFISIGLLAFAFEDKFKPKIYEAEGTGIGYNGDITLKVKASLKPSDVKVAPATMSILSSLCLALTSSTNFVQQTPPMTSVSPCST